MLQLARVQDQTNCHLQQHIQQGQLNMQAHAGALHQLANSTHQRNYDHIFTSITIYDRSNREEFFPWLDHLEAACYHCERDIKTEALGRSAGPVQNVIMALPHNKSWSAIREELKHCFLRPNITWTYCCPIREYDSETKRTTKTVYLPLF